MEILNRSKLVTVAEMQHIEQRADASGHNYATMMEMAGQATAQAIIERWHTNIAGDASPLKAVLILVGPGNNGGDGLVCARHLHEAGMSVYVYLWKRKTEPTDDYEDHFAKLVALGIPYAHHDVDREMGHLQAKLQEADIIVDALLGTGNNRPIQDQLASLLDSIQIERASRPVTQPLSVVAVDCPSGLNCDTGALDEDTLIADLTVTFAYAKLGHYQFSGTEAVGELVVADIGTSPHLADKVQTFVLDKAWVQSHLPRRNNNSHKGSFGKVMAVVGSMNYPGAAYLSCAAAVRVGAGLVTGAIPTSIWGPVATKLTEATWLPIEADPHSDFDKGSVHAAAAPAVVEALTNYTTLLFGCGLSQSESTQTFVHNLLAQTPPLPTVIDADGLNCLAQMAEWTRYLPKETILTPHPAEMARLCKVPLTEILQNRWAFAHQKAKAWRCVILLKGPYTVVAEPEGRLAVIPIATPALATAGTGDVLAGAITGLLAQALPTFEAACVGAWLHGCAGLLCEQEIGRAGVMASDLLPHLPKVINNLLSV